MALGARAERPGPLARGAGRLAGRSRASWWQAGLGRARHVHPRHPEVRAIDMPASARTGGPAQAADFSTRRRDAPHRARLHMQPATRVAHAAPRGVHGVLRWADAYECWATPSKSRLHRGAADPRNTADRGHADCIELGLKQPARRMQTNP